MKGCKCWNCLAMQHTCKKLVHSYESVHDQSYKTLAQLWELTGIICSDDSGLLFNACI